MTEKNTEQGTLLNNVSISKIGTKEIGIIGAIILIFAIVLISIFTSFEGNKFKNVKDKCVQIAGGVSGGEDYFTIDTYPDRYKNLDSAVASMLVPDAEKQALEAIKYANKELGFNTSLYSKMLQTNALMGRQSEENDKYKVSWTYHPDDGLEVTYEKK